MNYRMAAFDLDGTIIGKTGEVSDACMGALEALHKTGCLIVIATGRGLESIPEEIINSHFVSYIIGANGAVIYDVRNALKLHEEHLPRTVIEQVFTLIPRESSTVAVSFASRRYFEWSGMFKHRKQGVTRWQHLRGLWNFLMKSNVHFVFNCRKTIALSKAPVLKLEFYYQDIELFAKHYQYLQAISEIEAVAAKEGALEITAKDVSKGMALTRLCGRFDIQIPNLIVFGDSGNDLSMRNVAGGFIAMGNAVEEVKVVADHIAESVDNDGVAKMIKKILSNGGTLDEVAG